jgi:hypothetical protein
LGGKGKPYYRSAPPALFAKRRKKATTSCRRFKDFKSFKGFRRAQIRAGTGFQDLLVYRYGAFGVQLWDVWCTDMGLLVCSYGRLWKIRRTDMGFYKPLKPKEFFIWCTDMGTFGVQLWEACSKTLLTVASSA